MRHRRREALRQADLVVLAGLPFDFRLDYGRAVPRATPVIAANLDRAALRRNRRPTLGVEGDPGTFLQALARRLRPADRAGWIATLRARDDEREAEIDRRAATDHERGVDPLALLRALVAVAADDAILVADGGDFVATAAYAVRPRGPLGWLDPGPFGTLGVGGGFALGVAAARPGREIWIVYGDGSAGYSLAEFDTYVRHGLAPIAVVGNDACWAQIAREQVGILGDDVGCALRETDYERVAAGFGGVGLRIERRDEIDTVLREARRIAGDERRPVLINALLAKTDFREGSISI
jgi:acetolactate synthase-1/2/3 large subunit